LVYSAHGTEYNEYGYFALTGSPILPNIVAGVEIPLFRFRTQACIGSIRMYRNVADGTGGADTPKLNSANSIYLSGIMEHFRRVTKTTMVQRRYVQRLQYQT
jgi:hypothetical protein